MEIIAAIIFALISICIWILLASKNLPPGPKGLPLVGFLPFIKKQLRQQYQELAAEYGDIFSFYIGRDLVVVLNSYEAIKEALIKQNDIFAGRPLIHHGKKKQLSLVHNEGEPFRDHKRFLLSAMKEFGFGKCSVEPQLQEEVNILSKKISNFKGVPTDLGPLIRSSVANIICVLLNGKRYEYDEYFQKIVSLVEKQSSGLNPISILFFPQILKIPGVETLMHLFFKSAGHSHHNLEDEIRKLVEARAPKHQPGQKTDFISAWFTEVEERKKTGSDKYFTTMYLVKLIETLFIAGTDTTANTLRWSLMYLVAYPEIQAKIQNEIDETIGHERMLSISDQDRLPYTSATIMEVMRITSLVPFSLYHSNTEETKLRNFTIPKRSIIIPHLWAVHHDPKTFPDPEKFNPERFLDENKKVINAEKLIPFSQGKRQCLGEPLARMELFVYFTSLLQKFRFQLPKEEELNFDADVALMNVPKPFKVRAIERF